MRRDELDIECQKLVELISAVQTSKDTLDRSRAFAEACGKGIRLSFVAFWAVAYIFAQRWLHHRTCPALCRTHSLCRLSMR